MEQQSPSHGKQWMLYGAYGFTGKLIAQLAVKSGEKPVLAGRNGVALEALAKELNLPFVELSLNEPEKLDAALKNIHLVLHTAGPFSQTSKPMVDACLRTKTHYLDITGEISVFEACAARDQEAKEAGIIVLPGVGFDVVPTDCLSALLAKELPNATHLEVAIASVGGLPVGKPSRGTAKTALESGNKTKQRKDGIIVDCADESKEFEFDGKKSTLSLISWGDVSTAFYSTKIPNIKTYMSLPTGSSFGKLFLSIPGFTTLAQKFVDMAVRGPSQSDLDSKGSVVRGEVSTAEKSVIGYLTTANPYRFTAHASLLSALRVLRDEEKIGSGFRTPSLAFGGDFVKEIPDVVVQPFQYSEKK